MNARVVERSGLVDRPIPRPSERAARRALAPADPKRPGQAAVLRVHSFGGQSRSWVALALFGVVVAAVGFGIVGAIGMADSTAGLFAAPLLAVGTYLALNRTLRDSQGAGFVAVVFAGLALRLVASVPRLAAGVDSVAYQTEGVRLAQHFRALDFGVSIGRSIPGTGTVRYVVGLVNVVTSSNFVSTYLLFTILAFAGQVFFLVGVRHLLSVRQFRILALLVMFWPSLAYWPSSIGKESLVLFGIGLTTFGVSRLYQRDYARATALLFGLLAIGMVRPHIAMIVLAGLLIGLFSRADETRSQAVVHAMALIVVVVGAMWLTSVSASLFGVESLDGLEDISAALDFAENRTSQDDAGFTAPRIDTPADYPWAFATVMFRPFPWEATGVRAIASGLEGMLLATLLVAALPGIVAQARTVLTKGQLLHSGAFLLVFVYVFSAIGNFGILSRQRVQLLPFALLFVALGLGYSSGKRNVTTIRTVGAAETAPAIAAPRSTKVSSDEH